MWLVAFQNRK